MGLFGFGKFILMYIMVGFDSLIEGCVWIGDIEIMGLGDIDFMILWCCWVGFIF